MQPCRDEKEAFEGEKSSRGEERRLQYYSSVFLPLCSSVEGKEKKAILPEVYFVSSPMLKAFTLIFLKTLQVQVQTPVRKVEFGGREVSHD